MKLVIGLAALVAWSGSASAADAGQLVIVTEPPGANVAVDGTVIGVAPAIARDLSPGDHLVQVTWPDGSTATATATAREDSSTAVNLRQPTAALVAPAPAATVATPAPPPSKRRPLVRRWWLWTAVGAGVAAIALGVGLGVGLQPSGPHFGRLSF